ncbi:alpha/beta fold hydrolase [Mycolicibacterium neworleansense]|uniref:Putative hydrolase n=1 Tax=Mycolicibacterium neworleansense TaxID=146018 RepID=A0A0H5S5J1_9MYCO|nr:alpha/beta hydrolase [Mycolicibacterium neworleansense]MCV7365719.1 alpha/beta hydrolase [Mycolicibacterium neworleansense]CRZ16419.1 putative hydrolase [Mycolicibacterium neworleansense]
MASTLSASDGTELVVEEDGVGPPVVFVHGSSGGLDSWADIAQRLTGYRTVRYARRNHPPSDTGTRPNSFAVEAADLRCVLGLVAATCGQRAHVVGGSYGATVALHAAIDGDERIASLALFEPPVLLSGPHLLPILDRYRRLCADARYGDALELFAREVACIPAEVVATASFEPESEELGRTTTLSAGADLEAMADDTQGVDRWAAITVPVLLMQGGLSWPPLPEGMDRLARVLPHAERVTWSDQSHFATAMVPQRVADTIRRFLAALEAKPGH